MKYAIRVLLACVAVTGFLGCVPGMGRKGVAKSTDVPPPAAQSKPGQPAVEQHDAPAVEQQDAPAVEQK